jgi:hypothetical protein
MFFRLLPAFNHQLRLPEHLIGEDKQRRKMASLSLNHLIQAITGAITDAQDKIHRFQVATIGSYFDSNSRPVGVDIRLPSLSPSAEDGDERIVRVPLLSLVGPQLLSIKDVEISFDVNLTGVTDEEAPAVPAPPEGSLANDSSSDWPEKAIHKVLGVDLGAPRTSDVLSAAHVTLRVECRPPTEGMARLIQHLDKQI